MAWRVLAEKVMIDGLNMRRGQVLERFRDLWPTTEEVEPLDTHAEKIFAYWLKHKRAPNFPRSPFSSDFGVTYLPAVLPDISRSSAGRFAPLVEKPSREMPRYHALAPMVFGWGKVNAGDKICFCGWPAPARQFSATNASAREIVAYYAKNHLHPRFTSVTAPWCDYAGLFLPVLPAMPKRSIDGPNDPALNVYRASARSPLHYSRRVVT